MTKTKELVEFIQKNELMDVEMQTGFIDQLVWSVFLDEEHLHEIEYSFYFDGNTTIKFIEWNPECYDTDYDNLVKSSTDWTTEEALHYRGY
jgi:hypothetical protein